MTTTKTQNSPTKVQIPGFIDSRDHKVELNWNYSIKGLLRRGETSMLFGPSNCGKTALASLMGSCIVTGRTFFGHRVRQGVVLHVAAEAAKSILDRLKVCDIHDSEIPMYSVKSGALDLSDASDVHDFIAAVKSFMDATGQEIVLIIIDTYVRSIGDLEENCSTDMTHAIGECERIAVELNTHVMSVHHSGKDADRGGRGSSAIRAAVDTEISLKPCEDGSVRVATEKQRTMPMAGVFRFGLESHVLGQDEDGDDRTTVKAIEMGNEGTGTQTSTDSKTAKSLKTAILTVLHIWKSTGTRTKPFSTRDVLDVLPPELVGAQKQESRMASVRRVLGELCERPGACVAKMDNGTQQAWRLL